MSRDRQSEAAPPDLIPVMNLVTILIPFLLMAASFVSVAVIDSTLPAVSDGAESEEADGPEPVTVAITAEGFRVLADEDVDIPCPGHCAEGYDGEGLTRALARVKDRRPEVDTLILAPASSVPYEAVIGAMDASRKDGDRDLFPQVVIAGGVK